MFIYSGKIFQDLPFFSCNLILTCAVIVVKSLELLSTTRLLLLASEQLLGSKWDLLMSAVERGESASHLVSLLRLPDGLDLNWLLSGHKSSPTILQANATSM